MAELRIYAKAGRQVVIEQGHLGKVVLEIEEARQVMTYLPKVIADAEKGMTEEERQRQIKEHEEALARLREPVNLHQTKEGTGKLGVNKEKT